MAEVDCRTWRARCEFLERAARTGINDDWLRQMGIEPGSERARKLEDGLYWAFQHCCTKDRGRIDPPADPSTPARPVVTGVSAATVTVALGEAAPLLSEAEVAFLTRALRFGLVGLVLYVANWMARRAGFQICPLVQIRLTRFGEERFFICNYYCGTRWYKLSVYDPGLTCPKFIVVPV